MKQYLNSKFSTRNVLRDAIENGKSQRLNELLNIDPNGVDDQDQVCYFID